MRNFFKNLKTLTLTRLGHKSDSILSRLCLVSLILMTIGINQAWADGLPYGTTMTQTHYNNSNIVVAKVAEGNRYAWDGGIRLGYYTQWYPIVGTVQAPGNWNDKYVVIALESNSVPYQLKFKYKCVRYAAATNPNWTVSESSDNKNWTSIWTVESQSKDWSSEQVVNLSKTTKYIKLCYSGNYAGTFGSIKVTDQAYVHNPKVDDNEISSLDFGSGTISSGKAELTFDVEWCNVNTLSVTSDNEDYFTVSPASFGQTTKYGTQTISVYYNRNVAVGNHTGKITISNSTSKYTKTVNVSGSTTKRPQDINWNASLVAANYTLNAEENLTGDAIATADNEEAELTYESDNEDVIAVSPDGKTLYAIANGTAQITATATGNEIYEDGTDTKTFTVTSKKKQVIEWNQVLLGLKTNASPNTISLMATATSGGPITYAIEGGSASCITLSGATITITGVPGEAYIIATQAGGIIGGEEWISATARKQVKVRDPNSACDEYALADESFTFASGDKTSMYEQVFNLTGKPTTLRFNAKRGDLKYVWSEQQYLYIEQYANYGSGLEWGQVAAIQPTKSNTQYGPYTIDETATKIRFRSGEYAQQQVTNISIPRKKELIVSETSIEENAERNVKWSKTISVTRSNIDVVDLSVASDDTECPFVLNKTSIGSDCSDRSTETFEVSFTPHQKGKTYTGTITITDGKANPTTRTISLIVTTVAFNQAITWDFADNQELLTTHETLTFDATTDATGLEVSYRLADGEDAIATLDGNTLFFTGSGTIHVTAYQEGNDKYNAADEVTKTIVIKPDTPHIATLPSGTSVTYLQTLSNSTLSGGSADITLRGVEHTSVAGSFAWTNTSYQVIEAAGNNSYEVTFTPSDGGMYATATCSVAIAVNKAPQTLEMNDGEVYVKVNGIDASAANSLLDLNSLIANQTQDPVEANHAGAVTYTVISAEEASISDATINGSTFYATAIGTYTIVATKAATSYYTQKTDTFTVEVKKRENTLTVVGAQSKYVDEYVGTVATNINSDATVQTSSTANDIARYVPEQNKIVIDNSAAKSFNDTVVTISIWQAANAQFEASAVKTVQVTVKKYNNALTCSWGEWNNTAGFNQTIGVTFSSNHNQSPIVIEQINGGIIAEYRPATNDIMTSHHVGQATWAVSQEETYKYKKAQMQLLSLSVGTEASGVCYMYESDPDAIASSVGQIVLPEVGTAGILSFKMKVNTAGYRARLTTVVGTTETTQEVAISSIWGISSYVDVGPFELDPNTTAIRFERGGYQVTGEYADDPYINNIKITRSTWLKTQNVSKEDISELTIPTNTVNTISPNSRTAKFYVDYSTCASEIVVVSNNPHITVSDASFNSTVAGRKEITLTYSHNAMENITAEITVYTPYENKVLKVYASTVKENQTFTWQDGFEGADLSLPVGLTVNNAATASSNNTVTYSTNNPSVIEISPNGQAFSIIGEGTATLTAHADGDDTQWNEISETKTITTTDKKIQIIEWSRSFTRLHVGDEEDLAAIVKVQNYINGTSVEDPARTALITYSCPEDNGVISLDGKHMTVIGVGATTITASVEGNDDYEAAVPVTMPVHVQAVSDGVCTMPLMYQNANETELFAFDLAKPEIVRTINIAHDHNSGDPEKLTFYVRGVAYKATAISPEHFAGNIKVLASTDGGETWSDTLGTVIAQSGMTIYSDSISLDRNTTHLKFVRPANGEGRHYIGDIQITRLPYIQSEYTVVNALPEYNLGYVMAGANRVDAVTFEYANVRGSLNYSQSGSTNENNVLTLNETGVDLACGDFGSYQLPITFQPMEVGLWSENITITDPIAGMSGTIRVTANVTQGTQSIIWNPALNVDMSEPPLLNGYATSGLDVTYTVTAGNDVASIVNGEVVIAKAGQFTITASQAGNANFLPADNVVKTFTVAISQYIYEGEGDWSETTEWKYDAKPNNNEVVDVIVTGKLTILDEKVVGGLTIQGDGSVTIVNNGKLTITGNSKDIEHYGDLYVANAGEVDVQGSLRVGDLTVEASIGTSNGTAESGQVAQAENIVYANAYIEIHMDPTGTMDDTKWYGFTVPFAVNAHTGVSRKEGETYRNCTYGAHYMIAEYDAAKRLTSGKGWKYLSGNTLNPGQFYFFTVNGNYNTYRFKASEASYSPAAAASLAMNGAVDNANANWNGVGNSTLQHATASYAGGSYVQVYENGLDAYKTVATSEATFVVGCPFFIQATETSTLVLNVQSGESEQYYMPRRASANQTGVARINLTSVNGDFSDQIYVSATDREQDGYMAGHDLAKAGESMIVPQMWIDAFNQKLSVHEAAWQGNKATCSISLYAPQAAEYVLTAKQPTDGTEVYLTYNGQVIWNITSSEYVLYLEKGTTAAYGLQIVKAPAVTTGVDQIDNESQTIRKVLINDQIYIITPEGAMFDVLGKGIKF